MFPNQNSEKGPKLKTNEQKQIQATKTTKEILNEIWLIGRELHLGKLPIQQFSWKQRVFGKKDNSLLSGINHRRRKLIQANVSSKKIIYILICLSFSVFFHLTW